MKMLLVKGGDHPRACGKHPFDGKSSSRHLGSPPRLRETRPQPAIAANCFRIPPAPAGNTERLMSIKTNEWDHPRACGKHSSSSSLSRWCSGITPAPAGNTVVCWVCFGIPWDHPRACGKHPLKIGDTTWGEGSPPRLRETRADFLYQVCQCGITPAPAGNTKVCKSDGWIKWDHPRACGKHGVFNLICQELLGIPPAPAGNTHCAHYYYTCSQDHPRACGKHSMSSSPGCMSTGSPPRLRETQAGTVVVVVPHGITPAPAGNTESFVVNVNYNWDHPRACGKHNP